MRKLQKLTVLFLAVLMAAGLSLPVFAEAIDLDRDCSVTVTLDLPDKLKNYGTLTLIKVAELDYYGNEEGENTEHTGYRYVLPEELQDKTVTEVIDEINARTITFAHRDAKNLARNIKKLADKAKLTGDTEDITYVKETAAKDGYATVTFEYLEPGLYLAVQKEAATGYYALSPFLISLPHWDSRKEAYVYDLTAKAKSELEKEPVETTKYSDKLPQSGQTNWPVPAMAVAGLTLIVGGILMRRRKDEIA